MKMMKMTLKALTMRSQEEKGEYNVHILISTIVCQTFKDRREWFDWKLLNCTAYNQLIHLKTYFNEVLHLMVQDETDTHLFLDMVSKFYLHFPLCILAANLF